MNHTPIILFGGRSDERHVSVASAQNVAGTLEQPLGWFWSEDGRVYDVSMAELLAHADPFERDYRPSRPAMWPDLEQALDTLPVENPVFVLALHGGEGEDGTVQRLMEARNIGFTGSGSAASASAFDKERAKTTVRDRVPVAESRTANTPEALREVAVAMLARHRKIVLKPLAGGSSRGLFFAENVDEVASVVATIGDAGIPYIIEEFVDGRELTVGVVDMNDHATPLAVIEIEVDPGFSFDYRGKYLGAGTREICPASIPETLREEAQRIACVAHEALGCEGYSRTDLIAGPDGVCFLELNTLPGLTTSSLVPQELREAGIDMRQFLERQIDLALRRRDSRRRPRAV